MCPTSSLPRNVALRLADILFTHQAITGAIPPVQRLHLSTKEILKGQLQRLLRTNATEIRTALRHAIVIIAEILERLIKGQKRTEGNNVLVKQI